MYAAHQEKPRSACPLCRLKPGAKESSLPPLTKVHSSGLLHHELCAMRGKMYACDGCMLCTDRLGLCIQKDLQTELR